MSKTPIYPPESFFTAEGVLPALQFLVTSLGFTFEGLRDSSNDPQFAGLYNIDYEVKDPSGDLWYLSHESEQGRTFAGKVSAEGPDDEQTADFIADEGFDVFGGFTLFAFYLKEGKL